MPEIFTWRKGLREGSLILSRMDWEVGLAKRKEWFANIPRPLMGHSECGVYPYVTRIKVEDLSVTPNEVLVDMNPQDQTKAKQAVEYWLLISPYTVPIALLYGYIKSHYTAPFIWTPTVGGDHVLEVFADQNGTWCKPQTASETWRIRKIRPIIARKFISPGWMTSGTEFSQPFIKVGDTKRFSGRFLSPQDKNLLDIRDSGDSIATEALDDAMLIGETYGESGYTKLSVANQRIDIYSTSSKTGAKTKIGEGVTDANGDWTANCRFDTPTTDEPFLKFLPTTFDFITISAEFQGNSQFDEARSLFFGARPIIVMPNAIMAARQNASTPFVSFGFGGSKEQGFETTDSIPIRGKVVQPSADFGSNSLEDFSQPTVRDATVDIYFVSASREYFMTTVTAASDGTFSANIPASDILSKTGHTGIFNVTKTLGHFKLVAKKDGYKSVDAMTVPIPIIGTTTLTVQVDEHRVCFGDSVKIFGYLKNKTVGIPGKTLTVEIKPTMGGTSTTLTTPPTLANGYYEVEYKPTMYPPIKPQGYTVVVKETSSGLFNAPDNLFFVYRPIYKFARFSPAGDPTDSQKLQKIFVGDKVTIKATLLKICLIDDIMTSESAVPNADVELVLNSKKIWLKTNAMGEIIYEFTAEERFYRYSLTYYMTINGQQQAVSLPFVGIEFNLPLAKTLLTLDTTFDVFKFGSGAKIPIEGRLTYIDGNGNEKPVANETVEVRSIYPDTAPLANIGIIDKPVTDSNGFYKTSYNPDKIGVFTFATVYAGNNLKFQPSTVTKSVNVVVNADGSYKCPYDGEEFPSKDDLEKHIRDKHTGGAFDSCDPFMPWQGVGSIVEGVLCRIDLIRKNGGFGVVQNFRNRG